MPDDILSRVVIVDDDPADAYIVKLALANTALPVEVKLLEDGGAFVDYYSGFENDDLAQHRQVVLLDINMPILSGFEALASLNDMGAQRHAPILMFSTSCEPIDVVRAYRLGVNGYVKKPSTIEQAEATMRALTSYWLKTNIPPVSGAASGGSNSRRRAAWGHP